MVGSKISFFGTYKDTTMWETAALPFVHPVTGEAIAEITVDSGSKIVSPERAADIRDEMEAELIPTRPDGRVEIIHVDPPAKI